MTDKIIISRKEIEDAIDTLYIETFSGEPYIAGTRKILALLDKAEITTLRAELEIAKKDGWISVDTALPDDEITFLSFSPVYGFQVNMFNIHGNGGLPKLSQLKITHWQPLPNPPKE